jgi:hypothetical protein
MKPLLLHGTKEMLIGGQKKNMTPITQQILQLLLVERWIRMMKWQDN